MIDLSLKLLINLIFSNPAWSQQDILPADIKEYYHGRNYINCFSLREERQQILTLLTKGEDISRIPEERLCRIAGIMKQLREKILNPNDPMNAGPVFPVQLLIPEINELSDWKMDKDQIRVWLHTYSIGLEDNLDFVASYTPDQDPGNYVPVDLSSLQYMSQEIHTWFRENGTWKKSFLNKILVK